MVSSRLLRGAIAAAVLTTVVSANPLIGDAAERLVLRPGWNLIGFPAAPVEPEVSKVFETPIKMQYLLSVWTYDNASGWSRFANSKKVEPPPNDWAKPALPELRGEAKILERIESGKGYWVHIADNVSGDGVPLDVETRVKKSVISYSKGWNLVCFDAETHEKYSRVDASAVSNKSPPKITPVSRTSLTAAFGDRTEAQPSQIIEYDSRNARLRETNLIAESKGWMRRHFGYWVYFPRDTILNSKLVTILQGDLYRPQKPPVPFPGEEDFDANRNSVIDGPRDQDTVSVGFGANSVEFIVRNEGEGLLSYSVEPDGYWRSTTSVFLPYPAVKINPATDDLEDKRWERQGDGPAPWLAQIDSIRGVSPRSLADGIQADVKDSSVRLTVDRKGHPPSHYLCRFHLRTSAGSKTIFLHATVPPLAGNFEGAATLSNVNGKSIGMGRINLRLCLRQNSDATVVGYIDSGLTAVIPRDVPLLGYQRGSRLLLFGAYTLPSRDAKSQNDLNPFNQRVTRFFSLDGYEVAPGSIEADIHDIVHGSLPFPVHISGVSANGGGVTIARPAVVAPANAWFPKPDKSPQSSQKIQGTIANHRLGSSNLRVSLTGMGHVAFANAADDGSWSISEIWPGIYRLALDGGTSRMIEVMEVQTIAKIKEKVEVRLEGKIVPADDVLEGSPTALTCNGPALITKSHSGPAWTPTSHKTLKAESDAGAGNETMRCHSVVRQGLSYRELSQPGKRLSSVGPRTLRQGTQP